MVNKKLRRKIIIDALNFRNAPKYLNRREGELVRAKIESDFGFSDKIYKGADEGVHAFVEYDWKGSVVEYLVHQDNLRVHDERLIMRNPDIRKYSVESETGKHYMELIKKTKFMELNSI